MTFLQRKLDSLGAKVCPLTPSHPHSLTHSHPHSLTHSHIHTLTHSLLHSVTPSRTHTFTLGLLKFTPSHPHPLTPSPPHPPQDSTQQTMLTTWLVELFLNDMGALKDQGELAKHDRLRADFHTFLRRDSLVVRGANAASRDLSRDLSLCRVYVACCCFVLPHEDPFHGFATVRLGPGLAW